MKVIESEIEPGPLIWKMEGNYSGKESFVKLRYANEGEEGEAELLKRDS